MSEQFSRDNALRLDAMIRSAIGNLDMIVHFMQNHLPAGEFEKGRRRIGKSMAELIDVSNDLYQIFPNIVPEELRVRK